VTNEQLAAVVLGRLRDELGTDVSFRRPPIAMGGGKFSSVYAFEVTPSPEGWAGSFVIRLVSSPEQVRLEAGLHRAAQAEGLRAPRLLLWEAAAPSLGTGYLIMERVPGRSYLRGVEPRRFVLDLPKLLASWPRQVPRILNALARVDVDAAVAVLDRDGVPDDLSRPGRHLRAVSVTLAGEPTLAGTVGWLHDNAPSPPSRLALVHGDLWPGNVFIDRREIRLIDWTRGGIDDPALDVGFAKVGFALMPEPFPPPAPIRQLGEAIGRSIARRLAVHCEPLVGGADRVQYYEALRCAVELADVVTGRAAGTRPGWDHGVPALIRHLENITKQSIAFS
jgi:aminoglycoside phosphotransferase (APT) family kinase protein